MYNLRVTLQTYPEAFGCRHVPICYPEAHCRGLWSLYIVIKRKTTNTRIYSAIVYEQKLEATTNLNIRCTRDLVCQTLTSKNINIPYINGAIPHFPFDVWEPWWKPDDQALFGWNPKLQRMCLDSCDETLKCKHWCIGFLSASVLIS